jgi:hypothetical protein
MRRIWPAGGPKPELKREKPPAFGASRYTGGYDNLTSMAWEEFLLGGVGGAIVAGGIGTLTAVRIDRLTAQRDRKRQEDTERAISRLLCSELAAAYETVERAIGEHRWPLWHPPLSRHIWDRHAHTLAPAIDNALVDQFARTYDALSVWQSRVSLYLAQFPPTLG